MSQKIETRFLMPISALLILIPSFYQDYFKPDLSYYPLELSGHILKRCPLILQPIFRCD